MKFQVSVPIELSEEQLDALAERVAVVLRERETTDAEPWMNTESAAAYLDCDPRRIHDLKEQGRLRVKRDGRRLLFRREWLDAALDEKT